MFHLLTHGIFKALLFLGSGSIIHGAHDNQDMRKMGGLKDAYADDLVDVYDRRAARWRASSRWPASGARTTSSRTRSMCKFHVMGILLIAASLITAFYMGRQVALIFCGKQRDTTYHAHESGSVMRLPLVVLAVGTVLGGLMNLPGLHWLSNFLKPVLHEEVAPYTIGKGMLATVVTLLALGSMYMRLVAVRGDFQSRIKVGKEDPRYHYLGDIWRGMEIGWGFDWFYQRAVVRPVSRRSARS